MHHDVMLPVRWLEGSIRAHDLELRMLIALLILIMSTVTAGEPPPPVPEDWRWEAFDPGEPRVFPHEPLVPGRFRSVSERDGLPTRDFTSLAELPDGTVAIGTTRGLCLWESERLLVYSGPFPVVVNADAPRDPSVEGFVRSWISRLLVSRDGSLWVASTDAGLCRLLAGKWEYVWPDPVGLDGVDAVLDKWQRGHLTALFARRDGTVLAGGSSPRIRGDGAAGAGLLELHPERRELRKIFAPDFLPGSPTLIAEDRAGRLWVAIDRVGVWEIDDEATRTHTLPQPWMPGDRVFAVCLGPDGSLWVATSKGVVRKGADGGQRFFDEQDGLPSPVVFDLARDPAGSIWALSGQGAAVFRGDRWKRVKVEGRFIEITALLPTRQGDLWIAGSGKLLVNPRIEEVD